MESIDSHRGSDKQRRPLPRGYAPVILDLLCMLLTFALVLVPLATYPTDAPWITFLSGPLMLYPAPTLAFLVAYHSWMRWRCNRSGRILRIICAVCALWYLIMACTYGAWLVPQRGFLALNILHAVILPWSTLRKLHAPGHSNEQGTDTPTETRTVPLKRYGVAGGGCTLVLALCLGAMHVAQLHCFSWIPDTDDADEIALTAYNGASTHIHVPATYEGRAVRTIGGGRQTSSVYTISSRGDDVQLDRDQWDTECGIFFSSQITGNDRDPFDMSSVGHDISNLLRFTGSYVHIQSLDIDEGIQVISRDAFEIRDPYFGGAIIDMNVHLPSTITAIRDRAFAMCSCPISLGNDEGTVDLGPNVMVGSFALKGTSCQTLIIRGTQAESAYAFTGMGCKAVEIRGTPSCIGVEAFDGCPLEEITIPNGVSRIGDYAFRHCRHLKSVTLPATVTSIGEGAFTDCDINLVLHIPTGIQVSIGNSVHQNQIDWT